MPGDRRCVFCQGPLLYQTKASLLRRSGWPYFSIITRAMLRASSGQTRITISGVRAEAEVWIVLLSMTSSDGMFA